MYKKKTQNKKKINKKKINKNLDNTKLISNRIQMLAETYEILDEVEIIELLPKNKLNLDKILTIDLNTKIYILLHDYEINTKNKTYLYEYPKKINLKFKQNNKVILPIFIKTPNIFLEFLNCKNITYFIINEEDLDTEKKTHNFTDEELKNMTDFEYIKEMYFKIHFNKNLQTINI